jgi:NAD(P)-dependent dehydrogenase (short-subunit alcohol dehydrogenase family)
MRLKGKRVLITCADQYMGPAIRERFEVEGAELVISDNPLLDQESVDTLLAEAGEVDILVANFAEPPRSQAVEQIEDQDWQALFDKLVHPLMRIIRAVTPRMKEQQSGKIVAVTSAAPLRGLPFNSAYCAARGAQNAFIRAAGLELARFNIQVNAIAQNYVRNSTYYPDSLFQNEKFIKNVQQLVPSKRVAESSETAELALFLASDGCSHIVGQIVPMAGGWATTT